MALAIRNFKIGQSFLNQIGRQFESNCQSLQGPILYLLSFGLSQRPQSV